MKKTIAVDFETHRFSDYNQAPKPVCLSWSDGNRSGVVAGERMQELLSDLLNDPQIQIVTHYGAYDFAVALEHMKDLGQAIWQAYADDRIACTKVREKLIDIARGKFRGAYNDQGEWEMREYSLADLAKRYLNKELDKGEDGFRLRYDELEGLPIAQWPERAISYAVGDAQSTLSSFFCQQVNTPPIPTEYIDARASFTLKLVSAWGIVTDRPRVEQLHKTLSNRMIEIAKDLVNRGLARPKKKTIDMFSGEEPPEIVKNMKAIKAYIKEKWPDGNPPATPKGNIQTDKETLEAVGLNDLVEYNSLQKQGSTYVRALMRDIIHAIFNELVVSGRTSCAKPNLQNQPRLPGIRECFIPRPGHVFAAADYDAQEMRTLAQCCSDICGRSKLAEMFRNNPHFDPHQQFADTFPQAIPSRQHAKVGNFGLPGGLGARTLVGYARSTFGINIDHNQATKIKEAYFHQWPEMRLYFDYVESIVGAAGIGTFKVPRTGFIRGQCGYTDGANLGFQSMAAHATKKALFEVARRCYSVRSSALYNSRIVNVIHDELLLESPEEIASEAAEELARVMIEEQNTLTPDVPAAATPVLMRRWSKNAKTIRDKDGRLVPWEQ